ncbi:MAG: hypothetical protein CXR31_04510 [Geobacter sp.]|nr:MAG: hypothetical protein CXR31_04510 [Geobacter sp.]
MVTDWDDIPPKVRVVYLRGQQVAIERMCRKLEVESTVVKDMIKRLEAEIKEVQQPKTERGEG